LKISQAGAVKNCSAPDDDAAVPPALHAGGATDTAVPPALLEVADRVSEIYVDADAAARARALRDQRYHTRLVPALRAGGVVLLGFLVWLHTWYQLGGAPQPGYRIYLVALVGYAAASWVVLDRCYTRVRAFNLGTFFLAFDLVWFAAAIFFSGGSKSWLFFVLLVRVADQIATSFRNVLVFAHLSVASYLGMLGVQALLTSVPISFRVELSKLISLYLAALYIATTGRTAEALRRRGTRAIRDARVLIEQLRSQTSALEQARARAEESNRAKSAFFAHLSHELRTPLTAALGFLDLALESDLNAEQRGYLEQINRANQALHATLEQILDLARLESNSLTVARVPVEVIPLADAALARVAATAASKGLVLERHLEGAPASVPGDPVRLRQVLGSLLENAVKYTDKGHVSLRIAVEAQGLAPMLIVTVDDTGCGIGADRLADLFELKPREGVVDRRAGGLGLGLPLTSRLVTAMRGRLWIDSAPGGGTHARLALPLQ
jgi:signal transduction histidine kinase